MWNKGLSYRERHGILNMDTKQDEATSSTIDKAKYHHSLGLVFFPAFDWKISETHPERQERLLYTRDQIVEEGLLDIPNIRCVSKTTRSPRNGYGSWYSWLLYD